jgi:hypothetical protein
MVAFRGLVVSEHITGSKPILAQKIEQYLNNKALHGFRLHMPNGKIVIPKGLLQFYLLP